MTVYVSNATRNSGIDTNGLKRDVHRLLDALGEADASVSLSFVRDPAIRDLNRTHRGKDAATDVLSFGLDNHAGLKGAQFEGAPPQAPRPPRLRRGAPMSRRPGVQVDEARFPEGARNNGALDSPERLLGDIVISVDTARRQAADYDATMDAEVRRLVIHGLLHLLGHDHEKARDRARMEREEQRLAAAIDLPWPY